MQWALFPAQANRIKNLKKKIKENNLSEYLISHGFFRQFLTRYPESNLIYSKMLYTNILVNQIRGDKVRKKIAREELWKGQYNKVYWHGNEPGIYSNSLRKAIFKNILNAERHTRTSGLFIPSIISFDFDMDGEKEFLFQDIDLNAYVHSAGGYIFELDLIPVGWNYSDSISRYPEGYHHDSEKIYDKYMRKSFIDHFFKENVTVTASKNNKYKESIKRNR